MSEQTTTDAPLQEAQPSRWRKAFREIVEGQPIVVLFAIIGALLIAAILVAAANPEVQRTAGYIFAKPSDFFGAVWHTVSTAYSSLFQGAIINTQASTFSGAIKPITETLIEATPLIFGGLGLAIGFRSGLFNIGAQGQIILGAIFAGYIGFALDLPPVIHLLVAILGGLVGGALWAGIAGILKARFDANEVIVTIMLNNIAVPLLAFLLTLDAFQRPDSNNPISPMIKATAKYPEIFGGSYRLTYAFIFALIAAAFTWWLMERSALGYKFRAVGFNADAAKTAGIKVSRIYLYVMLVSGALAGLAGTTQVLGSPGVLQNGVAGSIGFDAITVALLGRSRPVGIIGAAILFGALRAGSPLMQANAGTPVDIVQVVQAIVVLLIAAPPLVRSLFRLPAPSKGGVA